MEEILLTTNSDSKQKPMSIWVKNNTKIYTELQYNDTYSKLSRKEERRRIIKYVIKNKQHLLFFVLISSKRFTKIKDFNII